jgi:hypothetical protein
MEKSKGPATCLTVLGIEVDSSLQQLRLPLTKLQDITSLTKSWLGKRSATKRELLSFIGKLSFAARIVPAGRLFSPRLIHLSTTVRRLHHRIHLNTDARVDVAWWDRFLPSWNGIGMFIAPEWRDAVSVNLYTDTSLRFGAICSLMELGLEEICNSTTSLHAVAGAICHFGCGTHMGTPPVWATYMIPLRKPPPIVQAWASQSSKHPVIMDLLRTLLFTAAQHSFTVSKAHLPDRLNCIADALSCNQMSRFFSLAPQANQYSTPLICRVTKSTFD